MDFHTRELEMNNLWNDKKCRLCGRYFKNGEKGIILIPTSDCKPLIKSNIIMHSEEFKKIQSECGSKEEIIHRLGNWKKPKVSETYSEEQLNEAEVFKEAAQCYNFSDIKVLKVKGLVRCKRVGSSDTLEYNIRTKKIYFYNNKRSQILDRLLETQLLANVENKMHELLGDGEYNKFSATQVVRDAVKITEDVLGKN